MKKTAESIAGSAVTFLHIHGRVVRLRYRFFAPEYLLQGTVDCFFRISLLIILRFRPEQPLFMFGMRLIFDRFMHFPESVNAARVLDRPRTLMAQDLRYFR